MLQFLELSSILFYIMFSQMAHLRTHIACHDGLSYGILGLLSMLYFASQGLWTRLYKELLSLGEGTGK